MDDNLETGPTTPDRRLGFLVYRAGLAVARGYERALKPIGVTPTEAGVLSALGYGGPNHVRGLGRLLGVSRQTIVNVTKALDGKGWTGRAPSPADQRLQMLAISDAGRGILAQVEAVAREFDARLLTVVEAEGEGRLLAELGRIVDAPFLAYED